MYILYLRSDKVPVLVLMINHFPYHIEICQCRGFGLVRFRIDLEFPDIFFLTIFVTFFWLAGVGPESAVLGGL